MPAPVEQAVFVREFFSSLFENHLLGGLITTHEYYVPEVRSGVYLCGPGRDVGRWWRPPAFSPPRTRPDVVDSEAVWVTRLGASLRDDAALTERGGYGDARNDVPVTTSSGMPPTLRRDVPDGLRRGVGGLPRRGVSEAEEAFACPFPSRGTPSALHPPRDTGQYPERTSGSSY